MILLDTHAALWLRAGDARLGPLARAEIERAWQAEEVAVSAMSFWEMAMLREKGRIEMPVADAVRQFSHLQPSYWQPKSFC